ncbi:MAG: arginine--tRNA ligase [Candidatus Aenigmarchaeota archaeon]|nr:arginine--tRNA ligase [Candidatus Aenigmarchaeota archaeon]
MTNIWNSLKQEIASVLDVDASEIEEPEKYGDLAFPCFILSKKLKKNPNDIAKDIASKVKLDMLSKVDAIGPYVNFYVDWSKFGHKLLDVIDDDYGSTKGSGIVMMDVFQANPFKSFHIGHIKNAATGEALRRMLEKTGKKTITVNFNGDIGIHVARWLLYYNKFCNNEIPEDFTRFSGEVYAKSAQMAKEDLEFEKEAQELNRKLESGDEMLTKKWKKLRDICYKDIDRIKNELCVKVDAMIPESECVEPGKKIVKDLFEKGNLVESEGAIGIDMEKNGLGFFILLKTDGTAIYATKDIGLLKIKQDRYKFDRMIYVVGSEQNFYFKQLFNAFDILGLYSKEKIKHVSHGIVTLKEGKMASRLGNVITYDELIKIMNKKALDDIEAKNPQLENKKDTARKIALGAIMFQMLDTENNKSIKFDWDDALDTQGRSGPYLQYSYVRALNIIKQEKTEEYDTSFLKEDAEMELLKKIAKFPEVIINATSNYSPNVIANYLFELSQNFNSFYQSIQVLKAEENSKKARLKLVEAFCKTMKSGMHLLNIPVIEKM